MTDTSTGLTGTKPLTKSVTVWGAALVIGSTLAPVIVKMLGLSDADAQATLDFISQLGNVIGAGIALYGRLKATHVIG